jgi:glutamate synthase domain-containing protein 2
MTEYDAHIPRTAPDPVGDLFQRRQRRDPARGGDRHLRHPRRWGEAAGAAFRRPAVPGRLGQPLSSGRLPRDLRHECHLGTRFAKNPIELDIPITIAGMSFGALSGPAKEALGRGATLAGTSTTTGDGGMTPEERGHSEKLVYQYLPSRYGMNPDDLRKADAIEVVVGQGAKPGGGGMLLGQKITDRVAEMRTLPKGIDQRSACRHPDWTGPDDLEIKILELREITEWRVPIYVKIGATRPYFDVALAVKAGADVVVIDGMQGGTAATQDVFIENVGIPTLACIRPAVKALQDLGLHREVQLIVSGGIRTGADVAKALALGADAVSIGTAAMVALGDNDPKYEAEYQALGTTAGAYDDWHEGNDPAGITTQDPALAARLDPVEGGRRLRNYLNVMTLEAQTIARACGHNHLHHLEPEDLCALTMEAAAMAQVPLAGTGLVSGQAGNGILKTRPRSPRGNYSA